MFLVSYKEELNGKVNTFWEDEYDREVDIISDLMDASEGLPSNQHSAIREFAWSLEVVNKDVEKIIEEDKYKITIIVKIV
jgi:hypothetical protein